MHHEQMQAARAITLVLAGANLRDALAEVDDGDPSRGRALVQELVYGTLRRFGTLDAIAARLVRKPMPDPLLRALVDVALYQLDETRAPAFAVVDRAVAAAGALVRPGAKGLVNAILRRYLRERTSLHASVRLDPQYDDNQRKNEAEPLVALHSRKLHQSPSTDILHLCKSYSYKCGCQARSDGRRVALRRA